MPTPLCFQVLNFATDHVQLMSSQCFLCVLGMWPFRSVLNLKTISVLFRQHVYRIRGTDKRIGRFTFHKALLVLYNITLACFGHTDLNSQVEVFTFSQHPNLYETAFDNPCHPTRWGILTRVFTYVDLSYLRCSPAFAFFKIFMH